MSTVDGSSMPRRFSASTKRGSARIATSTRSSSSRPSAGSAPAWSSADSIAPPSRSTTKRITARSSRWGGGTSARRTRASRASARGGSAVEIATKRERSPKRESPRTTSAAASISAADSGSRTWAALIGELLRRWWIGRRRAERERSRLAVFEQGDHGLADHLHAVGQRPLVDVEFGVVVVVDLGHLGVGRAEQQEGPRRLRLEGGEVLAAEDHLPFEARVVAERPPCRRGDDLGRLRVVDDRVV